MRIAILSTYPPRCCGIATFSADLFTALSDAPGVDRVEVIAVTDGHEHGAAWPVVATIAQPVRGDYVLAARLVGRLGIDLVVVQHEYGIFGGRDGEYVLSFTSQLAVPYVVTAHTVLASPTPSQDRILRELCRQAAAVLVFTDTARDVLVGSGTARTDRIHVVPHGAPPEISALADRPTEPMPVDRRAGVARADTSGRFVLSTFGLVSPGKGIETALEAVAKIAPRHPEVFFVLAGRTHPEVARREGEQYRLGLHQRVRDLHLSDHVMFDDRFLSVEELVQLLGATDVFVTPYRELEQTVSGALTFALAAGRPVVSTPYRYAADMLSSGAGRLVPFDDAAALAEAVITLIEQPDALAAARTAARQVGAELSWPAVGRRTADVLRAAVEAGGLAEPPVVVEPALPPLRLDHLRTLTDDVGIVQHATGAVPNRSTGYCVDDVARLVQVAQHLTVRTGRSEWATVTSRGLSFLAHAAPEGRPGMHNLMSYDRRWLDHPHVGDHVGRTIWALGDVLSANPGAALRASTRMLLERICRELDGAELSPRTTAYALLGLMRPLELVGADDLPERLAESLVDLHRRNADDGWDWFEPYLAYDNARLSQAAIAAGRRMQRPDLVDLGLRTLAWYGDRCSIDDPPVRLPGNHGCHRTGRPDGSGDEQPLDAAALVEAEIEALVATGDAEHAERAFAAFAWFTGLNRTRQSVYDPSTGGCRDGVAVDGVSLNEGAESTLAYFTARFALEVAGIPVVARRHIAA